MIPRWLELEGIRSFVAPRRIDFADLGLFAVLGDTGAGKSSILEAIVYALFNGTTWDGTSVKELMSIGATRMRVRFCFALNDRTYTVSRSKPREGVATHLLECDDARDERRDGETAVNKRLEALLGVNRETFTKTVVLPQGEFAALLALADKPAKRTELLTTILGLNRLDAMVETLATPRERARTLRAQFAGKRGGLPVDPAAAVAAAEAAIASVKVRRAALDRALETFDARQRALDAIIAAGAARAKLRERLVPIPASLTALEALANVDAALGRDIAAALERQNAADSARSEADVELQRRTADGRDAGALANVASTLDKLGAAVRERERESDDETARRSAVATTLAAVTSAATRCERAAETAAAASAHFDATRSAAVVAAAALQTATIAQRDLEQARASCVEASANADVAAARVERTANAYERAAAEDRAAEGARAAAEELAADAARANAAAFAAQNRCAGEACPICDRPLPADFRPPAAADLEHAQRAAGAARKAAQSAQQQLAAAIAARDAAVQSHAEALARAAATRTLLDGAMHDARAAGLDPAAADGAGALAALRAAADAGQAASEAADHGRRQAEGDLAALRATHAGCVKENARANEELANCLARIRNREQSLRTLLDALPVAFRPALDRDAVDRFAGEVARALEDARRFDERRNRAALDAKDAEAALRRLEARRAVEILAPMRAIRSNLITGALALETDTRALDALVLAPDGAIQATRSLAANATLPAEPPESAPLADLLEGARQLAAVGTTLQGIDAIDADDARRAANERAAMAELLGTQSAASRAALAELRDGALQAEAVAGQTLTLAQAALRDAADLDARLAALEPLARALDALHAALGDGKFKRFVAARKEQRLLGVATTILGRMTDERYGFGPGMRIVDRSAGQERSPQTLSGGEKFLASLALAFALVEIAARSGGHFGALFLDEGFGSLDVRALDGALSELERQAAGGRMIGVITHVREVSEYIDDVLRVWRTPAGSDVARLGRADLDALVAETATLAIGNP